MYTLVRDGALVFSYLEVFEKLQVAIHTGYTPTVDAGFEVIHKSLYNLV